MGILSVLKTGWNFLFNTKLTTNEVLDKLSGQNAAASIPKFRASIGFGDAKLPDATGLDKYLDERAKNAHGFAKVMVNDTSIPDTLKANAADSAALAAAKTQLKTGIAHMFAKDDALKAAETHFKKSLQAIKEAIDDPKNEFSAFDWITFMYEQVRDPAKSAIKHQHQVEKQNQEDLFDEDKNHNYDDLKLALGIDTTEDIAKVKKDMVSALETRQKNELETFDKGMNDSLEKLLEAAKRDLYTRATLNSLSNNKENAAKIEESYRKNLKQDETGFLTVSSGTDTAQLKGVDLKGEGLLRSFYGRKMKRTGEGALEMDLPNHWFACLAPWNWADQGLFYYSSASQKTKVDLTSMIQQIRSEGYPKINVTLDASDPEEELELARQAYEVCIEQGYKPEDIKIYGLHQKESLLTKDILFGSCQPRLQAAFARAKENADAFDKAAKSSTKTTQAEMKESIQKRVDAIVDDPAPHAAPGAAAPGAGRI